MTNNPATDLIISPPPELMPALFAPTPKAQKRFIEFFTTQISNDNTRRAYVNATRRFAEWCEGRGLRELVDVEPFHIAAWLKDMHQDGLQKPTIKQHLAAVRMLPEHEAGRLCIGTSPASISRHLAETPAPSKVLQEIAIVRTGLLAGAS